MKGPFPWKLLVPLSCGSGGVVMSEAQLLVYQFTQALGLIREGLWRDGAAERKRGRMEPQIYYRGGFVKVHLPYQSEALFCQKDTFTTTILSGREEFGFSAEVQCNTLSKILNYKERSWIQNAT